MFIDDSVLKNEEKISFMLRSLYQNSGYRRYKMSKFEEYDFYAANRDFLVSDSIITFTDTNGKLMALKPDVTLSIVRGSKDEANTVSKVYYDENVYRVSRNSHGFKEISQAGIECIGDIGQAQIAEVLLLAAKSLKTISDEFVLNISHLGVVSGLLSGLTLSAEDEKKALKFIGEKNLHELSVLLKANGASEFKMQEVKAVLSLSGPASDVIREMKALGSCQAETAELERYLGLFEENGLADHIVIDFSVVNDMSYYNGIVFKGYVKGIPAGVLSGGQYDRLLAKMGRRSKAAGFAVYMDFLERFEIKGCQDA